MMLLSIVIATDFIYAFSPYYVYSQPVLSYILERTKIVGFGLCLINYAYLLFSM